MIDNFRQQAAAELEIALGHIRAAIIYWSPSKGLSPLQEKSSPEVKSWNKLIIHADALKKFMSDEGP